MQFDHILMYTVFKQYIFLSFIAWQPVVKTAHTAIHFVCYPVLSILSVVVKSFQKQRCVSLSQQLLKPVQVQLPYSFIEFEEA